MNPESKKIVSTEPLHDGIVPILRQRCLDQGKPEMFDAFIAARDQMKKNILDVAPTFKTSENNYRAFLHYLRKLGGNIFSLHDVHLSTEGARKKIGNAVKILLKIEEDSKPKSRKEPTGPLIVTPAELTHALTRAANGICESMMSATAAFAESPAVFEEYIQNIIRISDAIRRLKNMDPDQAIEQLENIVAATARFPVTRYDSTHSMTANDIVYPIGGDS